MKLLIIVNRWEGTITVERVYPRDVQKRLADIFLMAANPRRIYKPEYEWDKFNGLLTRIEGKGWRVSDILVKRVVPDVVKKELEEGEDEYLLMFGKGFAYSVANDDFRSMIFYAGDIARLDVTNSDYSTCMSPLSSDASDPITEEERAWYCVRKDSYLWH